MTNWPSALSKQFCCMLPLFLESLAGLISFWFLHVRQERHFLSSILGAVMIGYLPQYFNGLEKKGGNHWAVGGVHSAEKKKYLFL